MDGSVVSRQFTFPSADGRTQIHAESWTPASGEYKGILQIVHGMVEYIGRYADFAQYMASEGWKVVGHDHLGHGESVVSYDEWGYFGEEPSKLLVEDMHTLRTMTQEEGKPYYILGHSMGSYLLRKYLIGHGQGLSGAIVMGTGFVPAATTKLGITLAHLEARLHGWHHRSNGLQALSYSKPYREYDLSGRDSSRSWLTRDRAIVESYNGDAKCTFLFTDNGYLGLFEAVRDSCSAEGIGAIPKDLPVLLISGDRDPVGDMGEGVRKVYALYQKAGIRDVTLKLYEGARHEVLNEINRAVVYSDIRAWMEARA